MGTMRPDAGRPTAPGRRRAGGSKNRASRRMRVIMQIQRRTALSSSITASAVGDRDNLPAGQRHLGLSGPIGWVSHVAADAVGHIAQGDQAARSWQSPVAASPGISGNSIMESRRSSSWALTKWPCECTDPPAQGVKIPRRNAGTVASMSWWCRRNASWDRTTGRVDQRAEKSSGVRADGSPDLSRTSGLGFVD